MYIKVKVNENVSFKLSKRLLLCDYTAIQSQISTAKRDLQRASSLTTLLKGGSFLSKEFQTNICVPGAKGKGPGDASHGGTQGRANPSRQREKP